MSENDGWRPVQLEGEADFRKWVERKVAMLQAKGMETLVEMVSRLPGVYPTDVRDALERLDISRRSKKCTAARIRLRRRARRGRAAAQQRLRLPVPHPLDYDWRFAPAATQHLLDRMTEVVPLGAGVCLLGAPTVFAEGLARRVDRDLFLVDATGAALSRLAPIARPGRLFLRDLLREEAPELEAPLVIADPPWYEEYMRAFLWAARRAVCKGGIILMSVPPPGTRPGIEADLAAILDWVRDLGCELGGIERAVLPYLSPPFERNALAAEGLDGLPLTWRRGDLVTLRCVGACGVARPAFPASRTHWVEATHGDVRLRIRGTGSTGFADPRLQPLVDGDVLPSVSRRDPRRSSVDVWTSGNRVYGCRAPHILVVIATAIAGSEPAVDRVGAHLGRALTVDEAHLVRRAAGQLEAVLALEQLEIAAYMDACQVAA